VRGTRLSLAWQGHDSRLFPAVAEMGASVLDFGIIPDSAGVQGLETALDNAVHNGADVLITSGTGWRASSKCC